MAIQKWDIGNEIAKRRLDRNLSQEKLAELIGTSRNTVVRIENGNQMPRADTVAEICEALKIPAGAIFPERLTSYSQGDERLRKLEKGIADLSPANRDTFFQMSEIFLTGLSTGKR